MVYNIHLSFIHCRKHSFVQDTVKRGQLTMTLYITHIHVPLSLCKIRFSVLFFVVVCLSNITLLNNLSLKTCCGLSVQEPFKSILKSISSFNMS